MTWRTINCVIAVAATLFAVEDAGACGRCIQRQLEQLRRHEIAMAELNNLTSSGGMLGPEYVGWITTPVNVGEKTWRLRNR